MELVALDWAIIVTYLAFALGIGFLFRGRAGRSLAEYFVSGRSLPWWLAGTSMVATTFAADTPLAVTGLVARHGLAGNWFWWSFALGGMITVFLYARLWRRAAVLTDVELVELRYGGKPAAFLRGFRAVYIALLVNSIIIGWVTGAMVTILQHTVFAGTAVGRGNEWLMIVVLLAIVGVYATLSGLWGVVVTDFFQFAIAMLGSIALAVVAVGHLGGVDAMRLRVAPSSPELRRRRTGVQLPARLLWGGSLDAAEHLPDHALRSVVGVLVSRRRARRRRLHRAAHGLRQR
jgi:Na+/proline symporter